MQVPHEVFEGVVVGRRQSVQSLAQHVQGLPIRPTPDSYQEKVIGVKGHKRDGEFAEIELQGSSEGVDVLHLRQVCRHVWKGRKRE